MTKIRKILFYITTGLSLCVLALFLWKIRADDRVWVKAKQEETFLRSALLNADAMVIGLNSAGLVEWVSPAACKFLGYSDTEILGQSPKMLMPKAYWEAHWQGYSSALIKARVDTVTRYRQVTCYIKKKDGAVVAVVQHLFISDNSSFSLMVPWELSNPQLELLTHIKDRAGFGVWWRDLEDDSVVWDANMFKIYGQDPKTYAPTLEGALSQVHPEDREWVRVAPENRGGNNFESVIVFRIYTGTGEMRYIKLSRAYFKVGGKEMMAGFCAITEEKDYVENRDLYKNGD